MNVISWCNRVIRIGFYLLFILVPLILTPWNYELFEFNKMVATYGLTVIIVGAWMVKMIAERQLRVTRTPLDIPIAIFVASQLVSALFSIDPHVSWFGYYSRFNGGMFSILSYVLLYYAFVTNLKDVGRLLTVALGTAAVVAFYGMLERMGIDKHLWVQDVQSRVFSTLGQPNWLAAYLVALAPIAMAMTMLNATWPMANRNIKTIILSIWHWALVILLFLVLLLTRSRSGLLGFAVVDILFWGILATSLRSLNALRKKILKQAAVLHVVFALIVFFNGISIEKVDSWITFRGWLDRFTRIQTAAPKPTAAPSGTALESGGTESGTIRKYVWQGAINAWKSSTKTKLIGTGTETFAFAFYQYRPAEHNITSEWDFLYNKAHNEYLNYLATTGVFGLGSYLLLIGSFIFWFAKAQSSKFKTQKFVIWILCLGLFSGWTSILVTNFFGFSVVVVQLLFFLIPAFIFIISQEHHDEIVKPLRPPRWAIWVTIAGGAYLFISIGKYWRADTHYAAGYRFARAGQYAAAQDSDAKAIKLKPGEPVYRDELASTLASLAVTAGEQQNATIAADLAKRSLAESDRAIQISPKNVNFWKTRTKLFYMFAALDPAMNQAAVEALSRAYLLSPTDPKIAYNLAILYGRDANYDKALEHLMRAKELKQNYRDAYFGLYVFYTELKKPDLARAELQQYLDTVDSNDTDFQNRLK